MLHMLLHSRPQAVDTVTDAASIQLERQLDTCLLQCGFLSHKLPQNSQAREVVALQHKLATFILTAEHILGGKLCEARAAMSGAITYVIP